MCVVHCFCSSSCRSRPVDRAECVWLCSNGVWEGLFNQADGGCAGVLPNHSHSHTRSYPRLLSSLSPHWAPSELAFIIPAGNHLEMWLVFGEDCSLMKNIIFKRLLPQRVTFVLSFRSIADDNESSADLRRVFWFQPHSVHAELRHWSEFFLLWTTRMFKYYCETNFDWLSRYVCPVVHAVTPVRVWCMMKRSWLVGQLTTPTSIARAPFADLRFCPCSMWTSETWVTRKGNLVSNQISWYFCRDIHHFKQFSSVSNQIPFSRHAYLPDRHCRWTSTRLWSHWQSVQQWQKRPCKNMFNSLHFSVLESYFVIITFYGSKVGSVNWAGSYFSLSVL